MPRRKPYSQNQLDIVDQYAQEQGYANRYGILRRLGEWQMTFGDVIGEWYRAGPMTIT